MAKILYFGPLADMLRKESENFPLLAFLLDDKIQVTINRQLSTLQRPIEDSDQTALFPIARRI